MCLQSTPLRNPPPPTTGAFYTLVELGIVDANTKVAGASAGALLSMAHCSGYSATQTLDVVQALAAECRARANCQGSLGDAVTRKLQAMAPPDAHRRCSGRAFISISMGSIGSPTNLLASAFTSKADIVAAAAASSFIPVWSGAPTTTFRGQPAFDGAFTAPQPCPPGVKYCIRIASSNPPL
jgi:hypothetical protein